MTNFGASFKKARESAGISLDQIAKETRISTRFLRAIEGEEFHLLPGGVFNRGFIRSFAQAVGLDPDQAVADYERLSASRDPVDAVSTARSHPSTIERQLYPVALAFLVIAVAVFYLFTREPAQTAEVPAPAVEKVVPVPADAAPEPAPAAEPVLTPVAAEPEQTLRIEIEAREKTWVKVSSDGIPVIAGEILEPGMTRKFTADASISISIGNAAGLTIKINDMPAKPLGKSGEVKSVTITPDNVTDFIG